MPQPYLPRQQLETDSPQTVNVIIQLLSICVNTTYFQAEDKFDQQEFGIVTGSPLSLILSNIYME